MEVDLQKTLGRVTLSPEAKYAARVSEGKLKDINVQGLLKKMIKSQKVMLNPEGRFRLRKQYDSSLKRSLSHLASYIKQRESNTCQTMLDTFL